MRITDFELVSYTVRPGQVALSIAGRVQGSMPAGVLEAKINDLKALSCTVLDGDGSTRAVLDLSRLETVAANGETKKGAIKGALRTPLFERGEAVAICEEIFTAMEQRRNAGALPMRTAEQVAARESALACAPTLQWEAVWESQLSLTLGGDVELD